MKFGFRFNRGGNQIIVKYPTDGFWKYSIRRILVLLVFITFLLSACQSNEAQKMFDKGLALWEAEKYDEAIQNFVALTKAFPEHHLVDDSLFWTANIYEHSLKDSKQTIRFYRSLSTQFVNSEYYLQSLFGLARVRALEGDEGKRKAIRIHRKLQKQLEIDQKHSEWEKNQIRLAQLFFDLKQYQQTRVELKQLIIKRPNSRLLPKAYHKIGRSFILEGKIELARLTFQEADKKFLQQKSTLASAISLANIYEQSGQLKKAIGVYQTVKDRLERKDVFYQLAKDQIKKLTLRLRKTNTG